MSILERKEKEIVLGENELVKIIGPITEPVRIKNRSNSVRVYIKKGCYLKGEKVKENILIEDGYVIQPNAVISMHKVETWLAAVFTGTVDVEKITFTGADMPSFKDPRTGENRKISVTMQLKYSVNNVAYSKIIENADIRGIRKDFLLTSKRDDLHLFVKKCFTEDVISKLESSADGMKKLMNEQEWQAAIRESLNGDVSISKSNGIYIAFLNLGLESTEEGLDKDDKMLNLRAREDTERKRRYNREIEDTQHDEKKRDIKNEGKNRRNVDNAKTRAYIDGLYNFKANFRRKILSNPKELNKLMGCFRKKKGLNGFFLSERNPQGDDQLMNLLYNLLNDDSGFRKETIKASRKMRGILSSNQHSDNPNGVKRRFKNE